MAIQAALAWPPFNTSEGKVTEPYKQAAAEVFGQVQRQLLKG